MSKQFFVPVCTLLAEKSPQALPLGAACIVTGIQTYFEKNHLKIGTVTSKLSVFEYSATPIHRQTEAIAQRLLQDAPFALCFSLYLWNRPVLEQAARIVKRINPAVYLIAGGPEVTAGSLQDHPFDFLVAGEGEIAVPQLLHKLITLQNSQQQTAKENLPEQYVRSNRIPYEQLTSPYLSGVLNPQDYQGGALWELARGCPFKCAYCYESKGEKTVSYFPVERIKKELEFFAEKKVVQVFVLDPTYNAQKNRALEILNLIKTITPHTFYHFECRAEFLNPEMAKAFSHIPCSLQIGLQSAHENVLKLVDRSFNKKDFIKKINMLNQQGVVFGFDLIYGLPQDTLQGFRESIDFAISLYPNSLELFRLAVLPGTTLFDKKDLLGLTAQQEPPYLVQSTETFSPHHLEQAEKLARATSLFYTAGRAVPWFHSVLTPLRCKPSRFFESFAQFLEEKHRSVNTATTTYPQKDIEELQVQFVSKEYKEKKLSHLLPVALDLIRLQGAFSRAYADGETTVLHLTYHPEDLFSPYAQDVVFFQKGAKKSPLKIKVYPHKKGPQWKNLK